MQRCHDFTLISTAHSPIEWLKIGCGGNAVESPGWLNPSALRIRLDSHCHLHPWPDSAPIRFEYSIWINFVQCWSIFEFNFDRFWSILFHFDQFYPILIHFSSIFEQFYSNVCIFQWIWSKFDSFFIYFIRHLSILHAVLINFDQFYPNWFIWKWFLLHFDPFWPISIHFDPFKIHIWFILIHFRSIFGPLRIRLDSYCALHPRPMILIHNSSPIRFHPFESFFLIWYLRMGGGVHYDSLSSAAVQFPILDLSVFDWSRICWMNWIGCGLMQFTNSGCPVAASFYLISFDSFWSNTIPICQALMRFIRISVCWMKISKSKIESWFVHFYSFRFNFDLFDPF